jgi:hypothetical protein
MTSLLGTLGEILHNVDAGGGGTSGKQVITFLGGRLLPVTTVNTLLVYVSVPVTVINTLLGVHFR